MENEKKWSAVRNGVFPGYNILDPEGRKVGIIQPPKGAYLESGIPTAEEIANRIVDCLNALMGIKNPEELVAVHDRLLEKVLGFESQMVALRSELQSIDYISSKTIKHETINS